MRATLICSIVSLIVLTATSAHAGKDLAIVSDIDTLCRRVESGRISAWSQPVYQTERWRKLAIGADNGDPESFCEMFRLMEKYKGNVSCEASFVEELKGRCGK